MATLVLLDHRSLQFPPFCKGMGSGGGAWFEPLPFSEWVVECSCLEGEGGFVAMHCTLGWLLAISRGGAIFW